MADRTLEARHQLALHLEQLRDDGVWGMATRSRADVAARQPGEAATPVGAIEQPITSGAPTAEPVATGGESDQPAADESLESVAAEAATCTLCRLCETRTNVVFGVGNPTARLMFIGEGPGRDEDLQGEPFVGRAGQLLDRIIVAMGLERSQVYIANTVKCRPPKNRNPERDELAACRHFLLRQVKAVRPEIIVLLGRVAAQAVLDVDAPLGRLRGRFMEWDGIPVMCTYHPAYLLRSPAEKHKTWDDMQMVMARLAGHE